MQLVDTLVWLVVLVLGFLPLAAAGLVIVAGLARLTGRPAGRLDRAAEIAASAVAMGVYPSSLRGAGPIVPALPEDADEPDPPRE